MDHGSGLRTICQRLAASAMTVAWALGPVRAEIGLTSQPEPLGYPSSVGDEADAAAAKAAGSIWEPMKRADEPQVPAGFDPIRSSGYSEFPGDLLSWFREPAPASCCDRQVVDRRWMGPGELAYHQSPNHRPCTRDYTRVFRTEFPGRLWFSAEYLVWATTGQSVPALVTSSPLGTAAADVGVVGAPATSPLFGGSEFTGPMRSGARLTAGFWFTPQQETGVEVNWAGLAIAEESLSLTSSGGNPWLARPYVNAVTGQPAAVVIPTLTTLPTDPTLVEQSVAANLQTQFGSVDVLYRKNLLAGEDFHRRYLVGGFRYLMLDDRLAVDSTASIATGVPGGYPITGYAASDSFRTLSQFYGGEFGLIEKWWRNRWSLQVLGKVGLGASTIGTTIAGSTTTTATTDSGGTPVTTVTGSYPGGVLAQLTNPGSQQSLFAAVGECGITADYAVWSQFRLSVGYSLIYWSTVGRAAAQIDPSVNSTQFGGGTLSGPTAPTFDLWTTSFWAQGVNAGLEYQF
jgi:hypothetical protein